MIAKAKASSKWIKKLRRNTNCSWILREITDKDKIQEMIDLRSQCYNEGNVAQLETGNGADPFDRYSRFFVLIKREYGIEYVSKCLRAVSRNNPLGILPTELSVRNSSGKSTLSEAGKKSLADIIRKHNGSEKIYELGGLCGHDSSLASSFALILGLSKVLYEEEWGLSIQTQHPKHAFVYKKMRGLPYKFIAGHNQTYEENGMIKIGYRDHCGRPAITLALEREELEREYESGVGNVAEFIFPKPSCSYSW